MKPIFETCHPRPEVLAGNLAEDTFAARLRDVIDGTADPAYQDPGNFFRNTFPTDGLRTLAREVLGRLSGRQPASSPFIRLETSFGGGKTHNLIALYHLATGGGQAALDAAEANAGRGIPGGGVVPAADWLPDEDGRSQVSWGRIWTPPRGSPTMRFARGRCGESWRGRSARAWAAPRVAGAPTST